MSTFKNISKAFLNLIKESYSPGDQLEYYTVIDGEYYTIEIDNHVIPVKDIDKKYKALLKYCEDKGIKEIVLDGKVEFRLEISIDEDWYKEYKYEYADVKALPSYDAKYITFVFDNGQKNAAISLNDFFDVVNKTEYEKAFTDLEDMLSPEAKAEDIPYMAEDLYDIISDVIDQLQYERNGHKPEYYGLTAADL
jgi:hypothetical protein